MGSVPDLSVIVPSVNRLDYLTGCLEALEAQDGVQLEVVVVDRLGEEVRNAISREFPDAIVLATRGTPGTGAS